jgi:carboxylate/amino acid/amine transporter
MFYLILVTILWAFSFSLIGEYLLFLDKYFLVFIRVFLSFLLFLPFMQFWGISLIFRVQLMFIGSVQIGVMYLFLYHSYNFLTVPEILLFTIFTPFYVTLIYDILSCRFHFLYLVGVGLAILGAFIMRYGNIGGEFWAGFWLVQMANLCFALGQSVYKFVLKCNKDVVQWRVFGYFHLGALIIVAPAFWLLGDFEKIYPSLFQCVILAWLGLVASGIGYFLWNKGATTVDAGTLGIMNNALIPAGLIVNILIWNRVENYLTFTIGTTIILCSLIVHAKLAGKE